MRIGVIHGSSGCPNLKHLFSQGQGVREVKGYGFAWRWLLHLAKRSTSAIANGYEYALNDIAMTLLYRFSNWGYTLVTDRWLRRVKTRWVRIRYTNIQSTTGSRLKRVLHSPTRADMLLIECRIRNFETHASSSLDAQLDLFQCVLACVNLCSIVGSPVPPKSTMITIRTCFVAISRTFTHVNLWEPTYRISSMTLSYNSICICIAWTIVFQRWYLRSSPSSVFILEPRSFLSSLENYLDF